MWFSTNCYYFSDFLIKYSFIYGKICRNSLLHRKLRIHIHGHTHVPTNASIGGRGDKRVTVYRSCLNVMTTFPCLIHKPVSWQSFLLVSHRSHRFIFDIYINTSLICQYWETKQDYVTHIPLQTVYDSFRSYVMNTGLTK